jgi:hypothetical protein
MKIRHDGNKDRRARDPARHRVIRAFLALPFQMRQCNRSTSATIAAFAAPVFGIIKAALGFRQFSLRGLDKVRGEWSLVTIEPFPQRPRFKGLLCRIVQIAKRHRDVYFLKHEAELAPISVIITTLAAWSHEYCVRTSVYDSELDVLYDVIKHMPDFIEQQTHGSRFLWFIWNETTQGENFAERWNAEPERARAFYEWHTIALADLDRIARAKGLDQLNKNLTEGFGQAPAADVLKDLFANVANTRRSGNLAVAPHIGLTVAAAANATPVRANTFYGVP